jgi:hypothetical protein
MPLPSIIADNVVSIRAKRSSRNRTRSTRVVEVEMVATETFAAEAEAREAPPESHAMPSATLLPVAVERQAKSEWCWVANALALARFHQVMSVQHQSQCQLVQTILNTDCSCAVDGGSVCNSPQQFDAVLQALNFSIVPINHTTLGALSPSPLSFEQVRSLINANRPIVMQIKWVNREGSHLIMLFGYETTNDSDWIYLYDPLVGNVLGQPVKYKAVRHAELLSLGYFQTDQFDGPIGNWTFSFYPPKPT